MTFSRLFLTTFFTFIICLSSLGGQAQSVDRAQLDKEIDELWQQIKVKQDLLLEPAPADKEAYADFLKQPNTGLIRLLPRENYDYQGKLPIRGGGAYYSFVRRTHEYRQVVGIGLEQGKLGFVSAGFDFGYAISLGDVDIDNVTLEHPAVKALSEYQPPPTEDEIRAQYRQASGGYKLGEFVGWHSVSAKEASSFVLRSLHFDESDILVAFRIVRRDKDGSLILIWKLLKTFPQPTAIRSNRN